MATGLVSLLLYLVLKVAKMQLTIEIVAEGVLHSVKRGISTALSVASGVDNL